MNKLLNVVLEKNQEKVMDHILTGRKLFVSSCLGWGKTFMAANSAYAIAKRRNVKKIGIFAQSWRNSKLILKELEKLDGRVGSGLDFTVKNDYWLVEGDGFSIFSTPLHTDMNIEDMDVVIIDEGCHVPSEFYENKFTRIDGQLIIFSRAGFLNSDLHSLYNDWKDSKCIIDVPYTALESKFIDLAAISEAKNTLDRRLFTMDYEAVWV